MTSMSSTGFGQYPGDPGVGGYEQRTSVMAILSLVCSLICFIPGLALLGAIFGIVALIAISRSGDRLAGRGLAISGLIISLIVLAVWVGGCLAATKFWGLYQQYFITPFNQTMTAVEQGDDTAARATLSATASKRITDADFDAFRAEYQSELGHFTGLPTTPMNVFQSYGQLGQQMQQIQGRNDAFPMPANFDNGLGLVVFQFDPQGGAPSTTGTNPKALPPTINIMIIAPSGHKWTLYDPQRNGAIPTTVVPKPDQKPDSEKPGDSKPEDTKPGETAPAPKEPEPVPEPKPGPG